MESHPLAIDGRGNRIACGFDHANLKGFSLKVVGFNNVVEIPYKPDIGGNLSIFINASNCRVKLGSHLICRKNLFISLLPSGGGCPSEGLFCDIGDYAIFNGLASLVISESNNGITIGNHCLFANNISMATSDSHKIYDLINGERLNPPQSIVLGDRVWLSEDVTILKGAEIKNDSICAKGSIVSKKFQESNVVIAGIPGKIIRRNIYWEL